MVANNGRAASSVKAVAAAGAGLSHVGDEVEEEGVVPSSAFDFLTHGGRIWMRANDVDCEAPQDREVLGTVVFSGSAAVLVEHDVEDPMQLVLDPPMTAHDLQQSFGGNVLGKQVVAHRRLFGTLAVKLIVMPLSVFAVVSAQPGSVYDETLVIVPPHIVKTPAIWDPVNPQTEANVGSAVMANVDDGLPSTQPDTPSHGFDDVTVRFHEVK